MPHTTPTLRFHCKLSLDRFYYNKDVELVTKVTPEIIVISKLLGKNYIYLYA